MIGASCHQADAIVDGIGVFFARYSGIARNDHRLFIDAFRNGQIPGLSNG